MDIQSMGPNLELLEENMREMAGVRGGRFRCEKCGESFGSEGELVVHGKNHAQAGQSPGTR